MNRRLPTPPLQIELEREELHQVAERKHAEERFVLHHHQPAFAGAAHAVLGVEHVGVGADGVVGGRGSYDFVDGAALPFGLRHGFYLIGTDDSLDQIVASRWTVSGYRLTRLIKSAACAFGLARPCSQFSSVRTLVRR